jgi:predicted RNase H-like nuclease (RuvC/YqgF family)
VEILLILYGSYTSGSDESKDCSVLTVLLLVILLLEVVIVHQVEKNVNTVPTSTENLKLYLWLFFHSQVKLLNKMKEEAAKHKDVEVRRNREIAQLRKESRKRENTIRSLEAEKRVKDAVLKRKKEEVTALRKMQRGPLSNKAAGRIGPRHG